ncbi:MAG: nicotinamide riboside transporter PnuC [Bacteroidia bacterium]
MSNLEIIGFAFGVAGVWLTIKENIWCFPIGIINVLITAYLVFNKTLFADTLQQLVYFVLLIVGWVKWKNQKQFTVDKVSWLDKNLYLPFIIIFISGSFIMGFIFKNYSIASFPFWDSLATVICFIAQWMIAKRKIENWLLWMIANPMYVIMYWLKDLPMYSVLSVLYFVMAVNGWFAWRKSFKQQIHAA